MNLGGRPGKLQVLAPAAVTVAVDFTVTLHFGTDPDPDPARHKAVPITITRHPLTRPMYHADTWRRRHHRHRRRATLWPWRHNDRP